MEVEDRGTVIVNAVTKKGDGSRSYTKKHYCLFCFKPYSKKARHLEYVHANEKEVAKACIFPKGSQERRIHLDHLRNGGNFAHNAAVMKTDQGNLVPTKQPCQETQGSDFMHCAYCQGLFTRKVLWRHVKICNLRPKGLTAKPGKNHVQSLCAFMGPVPSDVSEGLWKLMSNMTQDEITFAAKNDKCIIQLGQHMLNRYGPYVKRHEHIWQKLRELGRPLISSRNVTPLKNMENFIDPKHYMDIVNAVKLTWGYNNLTDKYKTGELAHKLRNSLVKISKLVESNARIAGNSEAVENALSF